MQEKYDRVLYDANISTLAMSHRDALQNWELLSYKQINIKTKKTVLKLMMFVKF